MHEETFNMNLRKFLKRVGITSQREIENAVRQCLADGTLQGDETLNATVHIEINRVNLSFDIKDDIHLV
jgi:hypothetical protein